MKIDDRKFAKLIRDVVLKSPEVEAIRELEKKIYDQILEVFEKMFSGYDLESIDFEYYQNKVNLKGFLKCEENYVGWGSNDYFSYSTVPENILEKYPRIIRFSGYDRSDGVNVFESKLKDLEAFREDVQQYIRRIDQLKYTERELEVMILAYVMSSKDDKEFDNPKLCIVKELVLKYKQEEDEKKAKRQ